MSSTRIDFDPYTVLGVGKHATTAEIKSAYRKIVLKCHPDKVKDESKASAQEKFHKVQESYELLTDENRRAKYDQDVKLANLQKKAKTRGKGDSSFSDAERTPFADQRSSSRKCDDDRECLHSKGMDEKNSSKEGGPTTKAKTPHSSDNNRAEFQAKERSQPPGKYENTAPYFESDDEGDDRAKSHTKERRRQSSPYFVPDDDSPFLSETDSSYEKSKAHKERRRQSSARNEMPTYLESDSESSSSDSSYYRSAHRTSKGHKERRRQSSAKYEPAASHRTYAEGMPSRESETPPYHKNYSAECPPPNPRSSTSRTHFEPPPSPGLRYHSYETRSPNPRSSRTSFEPPPSPGLRRDSTTYPPHIYETRPLDPRSPTRTHSRRHSRTHFEIGRAHV